jgi:hypothetical protein
MLLTITTTKIIIIVVVIIIIIIIIIKIIFDISILKWFKNIKKNINLK